MSSIIMSRDQVRNFDRRAIEELGIPSIVLMENAARGCVDVVISHFGNHQERRALIVCGKGNNGGDGFAIARHLCNNCFDVSVVVCADSKKDIKGDGLVNFNIIEKMPIDIIYLDMHKDISSQMSVLNRGGVIVDALFGTGLSSKPRESSLKIIKAINSLDTPVAAVDIPSGLDCDRGVPFGGEDSAVRAEITVTFAAVKKGFAENRLSQAYTGRVYLVSIGIEPFSERPKAQQD